MHRRKPVRRSAGWHSASEPAAAPAPEKPAAAAAETADRDLKHARSAAAPPEPEPPVVARTRQTIMTIWVLFVLTVVGMTVITVTVKASLYLSGQRCAGVCALDNDQRSHPCRPIDPSRLVFMRIPKTGSSSVFAMLKEFSERKWFAVRETCAHDLEPGTRGATHDALPRVKRRTSGRSAQAACALRPSPREPSQGSMTPCPCGAPGPSGTRPRRS